MQKLIEWLKLATRLERKHLVDTAPVSSIMLYQIASGRKTPSAEMAAKLEQPLTELTRDSKGRLPEVTRADISETCAQCPYAIKCLKKEK